MKIVSHVVELVVVLSLFVLGGCGSSTRPTGPVASVAGVGRVERGQLTHWTAVTLAALGSKTTQDRASHAAADLLIEWSWIEAEAERDRVYVSDSDVNSRVGAYLTSGGVTLNGIPGEAELVPFLSSRRVGLEDKKTVMKMKLLTVGLHRQQAMQSAARVPDSSVLAYFKQHLAEFRVGERRDIKAVMNESLAKVLAAKREMRAGVNFHLIEERFNRSIEGGLRLGRGPGTQEKQYERDYFSAPAHVLVGPRKEILYYVFEVFAIHPAHERPLKEVEGSIRERLAIPAIKQSMAAIRASWRQRTTCETGLHSSLCGHYGQPS